MKRIKWIKGKNKTPKTWCSRPGCINPVKTKEGTCVIHDINNRVIIDPFQITSNPVSVSIGGTIISNQVEIRRSGEVGTLFGMNVIENDTIPRISNPSVRWDNFGR